MMHENLMARITRSASSGVVAFVPALVLLGVFVLAYFTLLGPGDERSDLNPGVVLVGLLKIVPFFLGGAAVIGLIWLGLSLACRQPVGAALRGLVDVPWLEVFLVRIPLAIVFTATVSFIFINFKINIPKFADYTWDPFFIRLDRALFLGHDPWTLTHALFPDVLATRIFDTFYMIWFLIMQLSIIAVALLPLRDRRRLTFLTAYAMNWIVAGALLGTLFASVGPVYVERLTGDPVFAPLFDLLKRQSQVHEITALASQDWLWEGYTDPDVAPVGISAFPSLHLTIATTCACLGFSVSRVAGIGLSLFTVGILFASVHLGWHYAADGIAGIVLSLLMWKASARMTEWWLVRTGLSPAPSAGTAQEFVSTPVLTPAIGMASPIAPEIADNRLSASR